MLLLLLQRSPAIRAVAALEEWALRAPFGDLLRPAALAVAALGAVDTVAGATQFVMTRSSPLTGTVGQTFSATSFTYTGTPSTPRSFRITGTLPPGLSFLPTPTASNVVNSGTPTIRGTPTQAGSFTIQVQGYNNLNGTGDTNNVRVTISFSITAGAPVVPVFSTQPANQVADVGGGVILTSSASGTPSYQWFRNGVALEGKTSATLILSDLQPAQTGLYWVQATTSAGSTQSEAAVVGLRSSAKLVGQGTEFSNIFHGGTGFTYDQILLEGQAAAVTADPGQILRMSFIDLNDDIVQVEFSGPGTLSLVLEPISGPATPVNYNQAVSYLKGHARIVLTGATADTHFSVFSVGRANAANQALFRDGVQYDGFAGLAYVAIQSADGQFGGLRAANANFFATSGVTGIYAPGVHFNGPVFVGEITAAENATPVLMIGGGDNVRITGGDLLQDNARPVEVSGIGLLQFTAGSSSHGQIFAAQSNQAQLVEDGTDVTAQIVANP
jgi:hypothetical protein